MAQLEAYPFAQCPAYTDEEGLSLGQSNTIMRERVSLHPASASLPWLHLPPPVVLYLPAPRPPPRSALRRLPGHIGRKHGMLGGSDADAARIDMIVDGVEDLKRKCKFFCCMLHHARCVCSVHGRPARPMPVPPLPAPLLCALCRPGAHLPGPAGEMMRGGGRELHVPMEAPHGGCGGCQQKPRRPGADRVWRRLEAGARHAVVARLVGCEQWIPPYSLRSPLLQSDDAKAAHWSNHCDPSTLSARNGGAHFGCAGLLSGWGLHPAPLACCKQVLRRGACRHSQRLAEGPNFAPS